MYHGTISTCAENIIKNGIILEKGKPKVDFGQGFYTTKSYSFAKSTARNKAEKTNMYYEEELVRPMVLTFDVNEQLLGELNILKFYKRDKKWAQFIINNRNGFEYMNNVGSHFHNLKQKYDVVIGDIADNQISLLAKELSALKLRMTDDDLNNMQYMYPTNQISFHTKRSLTCIKLLECDMIETNKWKGDVVNE